MDMNVIIPRQHRVSFSRFLSHKDPRIRAVAREMQALDAQTRAEWRQMRREEREIEDHMPETWEDREVMSPPPIPHTAMDGEDVDDDEIPF